MKQLRQFSVLIFLSVLIGLTGCGKVGSTLTNLGDSFGPKGKVEIAVTLPNIPLPNEYKTSAITDAKILEIICSNNSQQIISTVSVTGATTITRLELGIGTWDVQVNLKTQSSISIYQGTTSLKINTDQTTSANIELSPILAKVRFEISNIKSDLATVTQLEINASTNAEIVTQNIEYPGNAVNAMMVLNTATWSVSIKAKDANNNVIAYDDFSVKPVVNYNNRCSVTLTKMPLGIHVISPSSMNLGDTYQLQTTIQPSDASQSVIYYSSNTANATVSNTGIVTMLNGEAVTINVISAVNPIDRTSFKIQGVVIASHIFDHRVNRTFNGGVKALAVGTGNEIYVGVNRESDYIFVVDSAGSLYTSWTYYKNSMSSFCRSRLDSNGNLFILDQGAKFVAKFKYDGTLLKEFGQDYLTNFTYMDIYDSAIAINTAGDVYILNSYVSRSITKFNANGDYVSTLSGFNLSIMYDIAFDANDNFIIVGSDSDRNGKIKKYSSSGTLVNSWDIGKCYRATIITDKNNNIYVARYATTASSFQDSYIWKYDSNGIPKSRFSAYGSGNGQLLDPRAMAVDQNNNLYVGDYQRQDVQVFRAL